MKKKSNSILSAKGLCLSFGINKVLDDANLTVHKNDRIGILGKNGVGKSTLLKVLSGKQQISKGQISISKNLRISYLPQEFQLDDTLTPLQNILEGAKHIQNLIETYENLSIDATNASEIEDEINTLNGWNLLQQAEILISSFSIKNTDESIVNFSGGEKRRIALCKTLISSPDLLILDEPTNHLDTEAIQWLETFLQRFNGAIILVTHDRYFLDRITTYIYEVDNGKINSYQGNYAHYLIQKALNDDTSELLEHKRQQQLKKELEWLRAGVKARATKSKSRLNRYYEEADQESFKREDKINLLLPTPPPLGTKTVVLKKVSKSFKNKKLFENFDIEFTAGQRVGIVGKNGLGKTTLVKIILGLIPSDTGRVEIGQKTIFNYVDQSRVTLNKNKTILEEVGEGKDFIGVGDQQVSLRTYLQRFLFNNEKINSDISTLSGGECNRVLLAKILKDGGNFLILDEPTNDLDLETLRILEETLIYFPGCILIISHDRYFLNRTCTQILAFEGDGKLVYNEGNYDYYLEKKQEKAPQKLLKKETSKTTPLTKSKKVKLTWREKQELETMEVNIFKLEEAITNANQQLLDPLIFKNNLTEAQNLSKNLSQLNKNLQHLYSRWQFLENIHKND